MYDLTHLNALRTRLSNERVRLTNAKKPAEVAMRTVWVAKCENEIKHEIAFLAARGVMVDAEPIDASINDMTDDELLAALES